MKKFINPVLFSVLVVLCGLILSSCDWISSTGDNFHTYVLEIEKVEIVYEFGGYKGISIVVKDYYGIHTWGSVYKDSSARKPLKREEFLKCKGVVFLCGSETYVLGTNFFQKSGELTPGMAVTIYDDWVYLKESGGGDFVFDSPNEIIAKIRFTPSTVVISEEE